MRARERIRAICRGRWRYALTSLLLLAPCFWQPRIQAGDLSSHMYNAWLPNLIEEGHLQGWTIVHAWTGVLFDAVLGGLFRLAGAEAAQRIAVSLVVLIFVWGAFAFVSAVSGRRGWHLMPSIAMLAYGWVFHMGFFDFYLSLGLCFWAMTLAWEWKPWRVAAAAPLLLVAYLAQALPVFWALGLLLYIVAARRQSPLGRACLTTIFVTALLILHAMAGDTLRGRLPLSQFALSTAGGQGWVFDTKYYVVLMALVALWGTMFLSLLRRTGVRQVASGMPFQLCVIGAAAVSVLPGTMLLPGLYQALSYVAERMSLGVAICICALVGAAPPRRVQSYALLAVACVFFGFVYVDERARNAFEDRMQDVISRQAPVVRSWKAGILCGNNGSVAVANRLPGS